MSFGRRSSASAAEPRDVTPADVREAALRILDRARRTRGEVVRKLRDKGYAPADIDPVLDRLAEVGLIDDTEYARAFLAARWGRKPTGMRRLEMELKKKGVGSADIARARELLDQRAETGDEVAAARKVLDQSARRYASLDPRTRQQRLFALLMRRGFSGDVIKQALKAAEAV